MSGWWIGNKHTERREHTGKVIEAQACFEVWPNHGAWKAVLADDREFPALAHFGDGRNLNLVRDAWLRYYLVLASLLIESFVDRAEFESEPKGKTHIEYRSDCQSLDAGLKRAAADISRGMHNIRERRTDLSSYGDGLRVDGDSTRED